jgi:hypothetical protein
VIAGDIITSDKLRLKSDMICDLIGGTTKLKQELGACKRQKQAQEVAGKYSYHIYLSSTALDKATRGGM